MAQTIKLKRSATEGKAPSTSDLALGELAINTYDGRVFFEKNDGSATIEHILTTDSITTGSITLTGTVTTGTLTLSGLSAQNSEATSLMINGSGVVGTRELGSNAFTSTTIGTTTNALTDGTGIADFSFDGSGTATIATDDSAIVHDNLSGFVANEHIDHSTVSITAGTGLNGGGTIASTRTLNVDDEYLNTSLNSLTGSLVTKTGSETLTNKTLTSPDINAGTVDSITSLTVANDIDIGAHQLRAETFRSDISTGTAPFTVASTTAVANLNADMVDGVEAHTLLNNSLNAFTASNANTSLNSATGSYITAVRSVTAGGNSLAAGETLAFTAGSNITITEDGGAVTIAATDTNTQLTQENVEDFVGGMLDGTETGITVGYDDSNGNIDFVVADTTVAGDSGTTGITPGDTLTIAGGSNVTTAMSGDTLTITSTDTNTQLSTADVRGKFSAGEGIDISSGEISGEDASVTNKGIVELATTAETTTGTDTARAVTPDGLKDGYQGSTNVTTLGTIATGTWNGSVIDKAYVDDELLNTSLNSATGSYITAVRTVTAGGNTLAAGETLAFTAGSNVSISESGGAVTIASTDTNTQLSTSDVRGKFSAGEGIDISSGEISGEDATTSNKGIVELATTAETTTGTDTGRAVTPDGLKDGYQGSTNVTTLGTIATGTWNGTAIDKTYLDDEVLNTSLNSATGSYQLQPSEGAFANGDKTKLDGIDTSADVTDATTVKAALNGNLGTLTLGDSNDTVSIPGNLSVAGTTTTITTTTVQLDDNILELNGGGTADGGIYVRDAEASTTVTGSLLWNTGDDKWTAGPKGSEDDVVLATATQTLTNKTLTSPDVNSPDIDGGTIDGATIATSDITVGSGKTLNVSGGTLTTSTAQKVAIIGGGDTDDLSEGSSNLYHTTARVRGALSAGEGIDFSSGEISGEDASVTNKGIVELATTAETTTGTDTARAVTPDGLKDGYQGSTNVTTLGTIATGTWNGTVIDKAYLDDEVLNTSLNAATGSYITAVRTVTAGGNTLASGETLAFTAGSNVSISESGGAVTIASTDTNTQLSTSDVRGKFSAGEGIDISSGEISGEDASTSNKGIVELATTAETTTGTDTARAVTPDGLKDGYQGSTNVTTLGTIGTGTWNGTAIASAYLDSDTAHLSGGQTFSGAKKFTGDATFEGQTNFQIMGDNNAIFISSSNSYDPANDTGFLYIGGYQSGNTSDLGLKLDYGDTKLNVHGLEIVTNATIDMNGTTQSTSKTTGTLQVAGGVGIAKTLNVGEDVVAYASSDERYKDLITPIENPNEKIKLLSGNTFVWNDKHEVFKGKKDIGVIAQEVEKVLPEIVETRDNGYKAVKYEKIVALLIESNKELIKRVEELEKKQK